MDVPAPSTIICWESGGTVRAWTEIRGCMIHNDAHPANSPKGIYQVGSSRCRRPDLRIEAVSLILRQLLRYASTRRLRLQGSALRLHGCLMNMGEEAFPLKMSSRPHQASFGLFSLNSPDFLWRIARQICAMRTVRRHFLA